MDDLKQIHGIGAATERKLFAAGIDSFAKLAAATPDQLNSAQIAGGPDDWAKFIAEAGKLAPKAPIDLATASGEEIAAQARKIEAARLQLSALADAVVLAHGNLQAIAAGAAPEAVAAAEAALAEARALVDVAVADARALFGVPEGEALPQALQEELAPLQQLASIERTAADQEPAGALRERPDAEAHRAAMERGADTELETIIAQARTMAATGELDEALDFLRQHRADMISAQAILARVVAALDGELAELSVLQATSSVDHAVEVVAKVDTRWRIGRQFTKVPTPFEPGELGADELAALKADPLLIVTEGR